MFRLGVPELLVIGLIVLFLFGGKKLPEMGKGIGEGIRNFKKSIRAPGSAPRRLGPARPAVPILPQINNSNLSLLLLQSVT